MCMSIHDWRQGLRPLTNLRTLEDIFIFAWSRLGSVPRLRASRCNTASILGLNQQPEQTTWAIMAEAIKYLGVQISLDPKRVSVEFRTEEQAKRYYDQVRNRSIHEKERLDSHLDRRGVSIRLPSRVTGIVASTTYEGFYLVFNDKNLAKDWVNGLLVWNFVSRAGVKSETEAFVVRDVKDDNLNKALGIKPAQRYRTPADAIPPQNTTSY